MTSRGKGPVDEAYKNTLNTLQNGYIALWFVLIVLLATIVLMWVLNVNGSKGLNIPISLLGSISILFLGFAPSRVIESAGVGGVVAFLMNSGTTQGIATGPVWLYRIVRGVTISYGLASLVLIFWSFQASPGAFWYIFIATYVLVLIIQAFSFYHAWVKILTGVILVSIAFGLWTTLGGTFTGEAFDANTGEPTYMMDPVTHKVDSLKRSPKECRSPSAEHSETDYATEGTCFSQETGQRLVPFTATEAMKRNPTSWIALFTGGETIAESSSITSGFMAFVKERPWFVPAIALALLLIGFKQSRAMGAWIIMFAVLALIIENFFFGGASRVSSSTPAVSTPPVQMVQQPVPTQAQPKLPIRQECEGDQGILQDCKLVTVWHKRVNGVPHMFTQEPNRCPVFSDAHLTTMVSPTSGTYELRAKDSDMVTYTFGWIEPEQTMFEYTCH